MTRTLGDRLDEATHGLPAPLAVVDLDALDANADDLVRRAGGMPIRVASKSVRVRHVLERVLARPGFAGVMGYSLREALWLVGQGVDDVLLGYPTVDTGALDALAADPVAAAAVTLMVDDVAQVELAARAAQAHGTTLRLCLDVDASLKIRFGPSPPTSASGARRCTPPPTPARSPPRSPRRPGVDVVGVMFYEAQVAGLPDSSPAVRAVKRLSIARPGHAPRRRRRRRARRPSATR